jgi:hypothetical protein
MSEEVRSVGVESRIGPRAALGAMARSCAALPGCRAVPKSLPRDVADLAERRALSCFAPAK